MPEFNCSCDDGLTYTGETLGELRRDLLVRLGYAAQADNPPPGMADLLNSFLRRAQAFLYRRHRALHTERFYSWPMVAGERFYGIRDNVDACPKKLDAGRITWVGVETLEGEWYPLRAGVCPQHYTTVTANGRPAVYEVRQCIEVFPAPDAAYTLRVKGHFGLERFTEDTDRSTVDGELLFLWALANAKNHDGQPDAADIAAQAQTYLRELVADTHGTRRYVPGTTAPVAATRPVLLGMDP
jgi:hypothetical protein